ncbi:MAG: flagellar protein FlaG [Betaproteobacteria bacterium]|nr:flagellar protein FlaG [Betaproteobacteria bacterium]
MTTVASIGPASPGGAGNVTSRMQAAVFNDNPKTASGAVIAVSERISSTKEANAPTVQESAAVSKESIRVAAEKLKTFVTSMNRDLSIDVDLANGRSIIRVVDPNSNEIIRQIPGDEAIRIARTIDFFSSIFVHQKA